MNFEIGISGLIMAAAITPGPNNLLVLQLADERGLRSTLPAIAGIVTGGVAMFTLAQLGLGTVAAGHPWLQRMIAACGAIYLGALGVQLMYRSVDATPVLRNSIPLAPRAALPLFAFQFINPKAWVLVLTVSAAASSAASRSSVQYTALPGELALLLLFVAIPSGCLLAWAALGQAAKRLMQRRVARARFDRVMGLLLIVSAISLLAS